MKGDVFTQQELSPLPKTIKLKCDVHGKYDYWSYELPDGSYSLEFRSLASLYGFLLEKHFGHKFETKYTRWTDVSK